jgi:hypothetical protein
MREVTLSPPGTAMAAGNTGNCAPCEIFAGFAIQKKYLRTEGEGSNATNARNRKEHREYRKLRPLRNLRGLRDTKNNNEGSNARNAMNRNGRSGYRKLRPLRNLRGLRDTKNNCGSQEPARCESAWALVGDYRCSGSDTFKFKHSGLNLLFVYLT